MIRAIAIDAAFANMGLARVLVNPVDATITCQDLRLITTEKESNKKQVRVSSDSLRRVMELGSALDRFIWDAQLAFVEVPSGAQSASAASALGMATGVLAVLGIRSVPIIEVSPREVKMAVAGRPNKVPKSEVIAWAIKHWPEAPWLRSKGRPVLDNEHLADAMAIAVAGTKTPAFQQLMALTNHAAPSTPDRRPPSGRIALM